MWEWGLGRLKAPQPPPNLALLHLSASRGWLWGLAGVWDNVGYQSPSGSVNEHFGINRTTWSRLGHTIDGGGGSGPPPLVSGIVGWDGGGRREEDHWSSQDREIWAVGWDARLRSFPLSTLDLCFSRRVQETTRFVIDAQIELQLDKWSGSINR